MLFVNLCHSQHTSQCLHLDTGTPVQVSFGRADPSVPRTFPNPRSSSTGSSLRWALVSFLISPSLHTHNLVSCVWQISKESYTFVISRIFDIYDIPLLYLLLFLSTVQLLMLTEKVVIEFVPCVFIV